jgi:ABC-type transporter Mla subunit MlaD
MRRGPRYYGEVALLWSGAALLLGMLIWLFVLAPKANHALDQTNRALVTVNRPCDKNGKNCGTLASVSSAASNVNTQVNEVTKQIGGVASSTQSAVSQVASDIHAESVQLVTTTKQGGDAISNAGTQLATDLKTFNGVLKRAQPIETNASAELITLRDTTKSLNDLLKGALMHNMLVSMNGVAANLNGTTGDIRTWTDREINPPKCKGRRCIFRRIWGGIKVGSVVAPGAYWATKFVQAVTGN